MPSYIRFILYLIAATSWGANGFATDDTAKQGNERFTQADNRTFKSFDPLREQTWQHPYFFMQLADTQYGFFNENKSFEQEVALVEKAVEHINRLHPRFAIVCGDLTNATPEHARYRAQVAQYKHDFSKVDPDIPLVCVCGNHDVGNRPTASSIASYQENFGDDYFSFWTGGVFNIVLNSSVLKDPSGAPDVLAAQQVWLSKQLGAARDVGPNHILLFQHHPLFLTQADEPDQYFNIPLERRTPLLDQLKQADVRAVFAGHYHRNAYGLAGDMEMVTTGPVGRPLGEDRSGFRIVSVYETKIEHKYWAMDEVPETINLASQGQANSTPNQKRPSSEVKPKPIAKSSLQRNVFNRDAPGIPIIFEAGMGDDLSVWDNVIARLPPKNRAMVYSRHGYGESPSSDEPRDAEHIISSMHR